MVTIFPGFPGFDEALLRGFDGRDVEASAFDVTDRLRQACLAPRRCQLGITYTLQVQQLTSRDGASDCTATTRGRMRAAA